MRARLPITILAFLGALACDDSDTGGATDAGVGGTDAVPSEDVGPPSDDAGAQPTPDSGAADADAAAADPDAGAAVRDAAPGADAAPTELDATPGPGADAEAPGPDAAPSAGDAATDPPDVGRPEDECNASDECVGFARCEDGRCVAPGESPLSAVIVLNEILIDGAIDVDANDDGDIGALDDEFVELLNIGPDPVDLAGATLVDSDILGVPRHTFPGGFQIGAGEAVVLFGGGSPSEALEATPNARYFVVNAQDPAFSNGLNEPPRVRRRPVWLSQAARSWAP